MACQTKNRMRAWRTTVLCAILSIAALTVPLYADDFGSDLDKKLLDDLGGDLLEGLDLPDIPGTANEEGADETPAAQSDDKSASEGESLEQDSDLDQLGIGEDVELGQQTDPLTRVGRKMRTVEELINQQLTSTRTQQLQTEIIEDITILIEQQKKKCAACARPKRSDGQKPSGKPGSPQQSASSEGAEESTSRLGQTEVTMGEGEGREEFFKQLWGNLPERFLQQIQNAGNEEFLPKYEQLIEEYYKRLAEEDRAPI